MTNEKPRFVGAFFRPFRAFRRQTIALIAVKYYCLGHISPFNRSSRTKSCNHRFVAGRVPTELMKKLFIIPSIITISLLGLFLSSSSTEAQRNDGARKSSTQGIDSSDSKKLKVGKVDSPSGIECTPAGTITVGGSAINGNLASGDCVFSSDNTLFDLYTLTGNAGDRIVLTMSSTAVDSYAILFDSAGEIIEEDDDSLGNNNARIPFEQGVLVLPYTGTYYVAANSSQVQTGAYQLAATLPTECASNISLTPGSTVNSSIGNSDCKVNLTGSIFYTKFYSFSGVTGQQLSFLMTRNTGTLDPYLVLRTPSGTGTIEDDNGGGGTAARLPATSGFFTLPETGTYILEVSSAGEFESGNFTLQVEQGCTYSLSPTSPQAVNASGGNTSVSVTVGAGCAWTATSNAGWITVTGGSSGTGNGTVSISVASNSGSSREGTLTIAGQTYTISQSGVPCTYTLNPTTVNVGAASGTGSFSVTAPAGCQWSATSNTGFITTSSTGTGNGTVNYSFTANTGSARSGTITAGGQTFTLNQESACANTVNLGISNVSTPVGGVVVIPITASSTTGLNISALDFDIRFDSAVLSPASPAVSNTGTMTDGWTLTPNATGGKLLISGFTTGSLTGSGTLMNLRFNVIATSSTSTQLTWAKSQLNEGAPCSSATAGTVTVEAGSLAGTVRYFFGQTPVAVPGVNLSATGSQNASGTSASNGTYSVTGLSSGAYTLTPSKTGGATTTAISALDASTVAQYSVQLITLTANQQIAADVTNDGTISALDASRIAQWSVGLTLPAGDLTGTWKFVPANRTYAAVTEALTGQDFTAVLMGDVTGNWTAPPSLNELADSVEEPSIVAGGVGFNQKLVETRDGEIGSRWADSNLEKRFIGEIIEIPISVKDASGILAYDTVVTYDADVMEPVFEKPVERLGTLSSNFNVTVNVGESGKLRIAGYGVTPVTGDGDLLTLRFRVKGNGNRTIEFESLNINETKMFETPARVRKSLPSSLNR